MTLRWCDGFYVVDALSSVRFASFHLISRSLTTLRSHCFSFYSYFVEFSCSHLKGSSSIFGKKKTFLAVCVWYPRGSRMKSYTLRIVMWRNRLHQVGDFGVSMRGQRLIKYLASSSVPSRLISMRQDTGRIEDVDCQLLYARQSTAVTWPYIVVVYVAPIVFGRFGGCSKS